MRQLSKPDFLNNPFNTRLKKRIQRTEQIEALKPGGAQCRNTTRAPDWRSNDEMRQLSKPDFLNNPFNIRLKRRIQRAEQIEALKLGGAQCSVTTRAPDWRSNDEMRLPSEPDFLNFLSKKV
ncbi:hypothetical protein BK784_31265 [Bacillus thuringiensis serovar medellin]|uniref:Uncharacterized protein n=1 Tax=Bacillus thuringiensis subsp. medellin TaxID=79672 RepID=A0A9X6MQV5_BACTV|nr:hypothetical protein BK784_31265 [Bacillus thuringiensis serovar medellin]